MFSLINDDDIIKELARRYEKMRIYKELSDEDVSKNGGVSRDAIYRMKRGENISLVNFIRILRGLSELDALENVIKEVQELSLKDMYYKKKVKKRIFKKTKDKNKSFKWGDEM